MKTNLKLRDIVKSCNGEDNLQYQKLLWLPWFDPDKCKFSIEDNKFYYLLKVEFYWAVSDFNKYKNWIDFGTITMSKFLWKVDRALQLNVSIRIKTNYVASCGDILPSRNKRERQNNAKHKKNPNIKNIEVFKKRRLEWSGKITPIPPWLSKKWEIY